jgi:hypothetical protein
VAPPALGLSRSLSEYETAQRPGRFVIGFFTLGLLAVIGGWGFVIYKTVKTNFTETRIQASARQEMQALLPDVTEQANLMMRDLRPAYEAEVRKAAPAMLPKLQGRLHEEMLALGHGLSAHSKDVFAGALIAAAQDGEQELKKAFPSLENKEEVQRLLDRLHSGLEKETEKFLLETTEAARPGMEKFLATLNGFPRRPKVTDEELHRQFIHLWVLLLDQNLMQGVPPTEVDLRVPSAR